VSENGTHHIMPIVDAADVDRKRVIDQLGQSGIHSNHYPPVIDCRSTHSLSSAHAPKTEMFAERELTLPIDPGMEEQDVTTGR